MGVSQKLHFLGSPQCNVCEPIHVLPIHCFADYQAIQTHDWSNATKLLSNQLKSWKGVFLWEVFLAEKSKKNWSFGIEKIPKELMQQCANTKGNNPGL